MWKEFLKDENEASDELSNSPSELVVLNNVNDVVCSILAVEEINEERKFEELKKWFENKKNLLQCMKSRKQIDLQELSMQDENVES